MLKNLVRRSLKRTCLLDVGSISTKASSKGCLAKLATRLLQSVTGPNSNPEKKIKHLPPHLAANYQYFLHYTLQIKGCGRYVHTWDCSKSQPAYPSVDTSNYVLSDLVDIASIQIQCSLTDLSRDWTTVINFQVISSSAPLFHQM